MDGFLDRGSIPRYSIKQDRLDRAYPIFLFYEEDS